MTRFKLPRTTPKPTGNCPVTELLTTGQLRSAATRLAKICDRHGQLLFPNLRKYVEVFDFNVIKEEGYVTVRVASKYKSLTFDYRMAEPVDPAAVQLRALLEAHRRYKLTTLQGHPQIEDRDDPDEGGPIPQAALVSFALKASSRPDVGNVFPVTVAVAPSRTGTPIVYPVPQYVLDFYELPGCEEAKREFAKSWISVDNPDGVAKASGKIFQPVRNNAVPSPTYVRGHVAYLYDQNLAQFIEYLPPPSWKFVDLLRIPVPEGKKSGITTLQRDQFLDALGHTIKLQSSADKETLRVSAAHEIALDAYYLEMRAALKDKPVTFEDLFDILNKMVAKAEVRQDGDDKDKVRLFFIVNILKYMMDVNMKKATHRHRMNNGSNMIGHSWVGGGGERFFENLGGLDPKHEPCEWWNADVSQKDTQFKAHDLLIHMMMAWFYYKADPVLAEMIKFSAHQAAFKLVRWLTNDEVWAFVIGVLLSGDLETGMGNTDHLGTAWKQFVHEQVVKFGPKEPKLELYKATEHPLLKFLVQGDDIVARCPSRWIKYLGSEAFEIWLRENYYMLFKEVTRTSDPFSYLDPDLIKEGKYRIVKEGIKFLKRRFIVINYEGKHTIAPFRQVKDYFVRVGRTTQEQEDPELCVARCVGLLWDTMGTNPEAENFLVRAIQHAITVLGHHQGTDAWHDFIDRLRTHIVNDEFVGGRAYRWSMEAEEMLEAVSATGALVRMSVIRRKFLVRTPGADYRFEASGTRAPTRDHIGLLPPLARPPIDTVLPHA